MGAGYLLLDGQRNVDLREATLIWRPATCMGRAGVVFRVDASGPLCYLTVDGWTPGLDVTALDGQIVQNADPEDPRQRVEMRFGRVTPSAAVLSIDGAAIAADRFGPADAVEADVRCRVERFPDRAHCIACGKPVAAEPIEHESLVGSYFVSFPDTSLTCRECPVPSSGMKACPYCGSDAGSDSCAHPRLLGWPL